MKTRHLVLCIVVIAVVLSFFQVQSLRTIQPGSGEAVVAQVHTTIGQRPGY